MRTFATIFVLASAGLAVYWFMVRPVLAQWAAFKPFYDKLNEVEATGWFKFRMWFKGLKGLLMSWLTIIAPLVVAALQFLQVVDITTLLPEALRPMWPVILSAIGFIFLRINNATDTPQGSPVPEAPAVIEVPTIAGRPDVAIVASGAEIVAVADIVKAPEVAAKTGTEPVKVEQVLEAAEAGTPVVVKPKEAA